MIPQASVKNWIFGRRRFQYLISALTVILTGMICFPLSGFLGYQTVGLIFLAVISFLPLRFEIGPILVSTALSALIWDFFFIPPRFTITIGEMEDLMMLSVYFIFAVVSGFLSARNKAHEAMLQQREKKAVALYTLTQRLSMADSLDEVVRQSILHIRDYFQTPVSLFVRTSFSDETLIPHPLSMIPAEQVRVKLIDRVYGSQKKLGPLHSEDGARKLIYLPLPGPRTPLGVLVVDAGEPFLQSREQLALLDNFVGQISSALEREFLNEQTQKTALLEESERLYKTLFNSISHELMTPLSAIMSATDGLTFGPGQARPDLMKDYIREIQIASERLNILVKNLLDMSRLESGFIQPRLDWCDVGDLFGMVVRRFKNELGEHTLQVHVPDDFPLFRADFTLIEQALANMVQNACMHTPPGTAIELSAESGQGQISLVVSDNGPALTPEVLQRVFDKFYRAPGSPQGGTGLGLSIAKGFAQAHKGGISAENRPQGGKRFMLNLPVSDTIPGEAQT